MRAECYEECKACAYLENAECVIWGKFSEMEERPECSKAGSKALWIPRGDKQTVDGEG